MSAATEPPYVSPRDVEAVLRELPADGRPLLYQAVVRDSGLSNARASNALVQAGARVWRGNDGLTWVARRIADGR